MRRRVILTAAACLASAGLSACGDDGGKGFEGMAETVASIPLDGAARESPSQPRLRPVLEVEVLDPHALWDARDGGLRPAMDAGPRLITAVAETRSPEPAQEPASEIAHEPDLRRAVDPTGAKPILTSEAIADTGPHGGGRLVQLGAYATEAAARAAWENLKRGEGGWALDGLSPVFEPVEVSGRRLVRLKTRAPGGSGAALCAAAGVDDPWCRQ